MDDALSTDAAIDKSSAKHSTLAGGCICCDGSVFGWSIGLLPWRGAFCLFSLTALLKIEDAEDARSLMLEADGNRGALTDPVTPVTFCI